MYFIRINRSLIFGVGKALGKMAENELNFRSKKVVIFTQDEYTPFIDILTVLYPDVVFTIESEVHSLRNYDFEILFLDTDLTSKQIIYYSRKATSVVIYGKVPNGLNPRFHRHCQIVKTDNVIGELWQRFLKFWNSLDELKLEEKSRQKWFENLSWVNRTMLRFLRKERGHSNLCMPLDFQPSDLSNHQYNEESLYVYCCYRDAFQKVTSASGAGSLTSLLTMSRQEMIAMGKLHLKYFASLTPLDDLITDSCEREVVVGNRIYRCCLLISPAVLSPSGKSLIFLRNPLIEVIIYVNFYGSSVYVTQVIRSKPPGRFHAMIDDISYQYVERIPNCITKIGNHTRIAVMFSLRRLGRYLNTLICGRPFAEQDREETEHLLDLTRNLVLDEMKFRDNASLGKASMPNEVAMEVFRRVLEQLKKTFTIRYHHIDKIMQCINDTLQL